MGYEDSAPDGICENGNRNYFYIPDFIGEL